MIRDMEVEALNHPEIELVVMECVVRIMILRSSRIKGLSRKGGFADYIVE